MTHEIMPHVLTYRGFSYISLDRVMEIIEELGVDRKANTNAPGGPDRVCAVPMLYAQLRPYYVVEARV